MTLIQALILAIVQGVTELFPVSSLGHAVLLPAVLRWPLDEHDPFFLPFLTMLHFGTLIALFGVFWQDWVAIATGISGIHGRARQEQSFRIAFLIVLATIPAVVIGGLFEHKLRTVFSSPLMVAGFLILNGLLLLITEWLRAYKGRQPQRPIADMSMRDALIIGFWQCLAFFPGISRSGATMNGGLLRGLNHETAAKFSLLMAQPVVLAATVKEAFELRHVTVSHDMMTTSIIAAIVAGFAALFSTIVLLRYFRDHERWALSPFAFYCVGAGIFAIIAIVV
ncbi:undecaprenyl-diphosphate phosphatase [Kozakia baliensis]|uniref:Undecaprenyl-diphosphatase n=1 Tax=Kozakia baliensis TaxID=153496 RepID=A0A1D8UU58_9PROT|nr:undecaprenyl-diphosphate phosphatase [Kozakia baliensis]AOX17027.1 undecaprenyl-diphosphatase [Kozakia baliensis]GBR25163.1 UDP pyrophosphate phosphatase [Kozakia baliensis NRIC 0488]GEL63915.1 undecaprenyl-diphosphatase [Kozakia baliensis]